MILKFFEYFRVSGTLSVAAWVAAAAVLALRWNRPRRPRWLLAALALAVVAWVLGELTSASISAVRIDQREEIEQTLKEHARLAADVERQLTVRYAEDAPKDVLAAKEIGGTPAATPAASAEPAYRQRGKQVRAAGKKERPPGVADVMAGEPPPERTLPAKELAAARHLDRLNRLMAQLVFWAALGLVAWDYARAFNLTVNGRWLLPVAGPWMDAVSPKAHAVLVAAGPGKPQPGPYAEALLRKGENLVYFGPADPWPGRRGLPRLRVGPLRVWRVSRIARGDPDVPGDGEFLLDAAWFGRYAVVVPGLEEGTETLARFEALLRLRHETGAAARRTLNLVWAHASLPPRPLVESLVSMAKDTNIRVLVWAPSPVSPETASVFSETLGYP
jgi:hypothetical protein